MFLAPSRCSITSQIDAWPMSLSALSLPTSWRKGKRVPHSFRPPLYNSSTCGPALWPRGRSPGGVLPQPPDLIALLASHLWLTNRGKWVPLMQSTSCYSCLLIASTSFSWASYTWNVLKISQSLPSAYAGSFSLGIPCSVWSAFAPQ